VNDAYATYSRWEDAYYKNRNGLRLGQAFLNTFFPKVVDSDLYNEKNDYVARNLIREYYLDAGYELKAE